MSPCEIVVCFRSSGIGRPFWCHRLCSFLRALMMISWMILDDVFQCFHSADDGLCLGAASEHESFADDGGLADGDVGCDARDGDGDDGDACRKPR